MAEKGKQAKLDLNSASRDELAAIPGIGASTADAIIAYRKQQGGFKKVDQLEEVSGIGRQTLESLRTRFKVAAETRPGAAGNGKAAETAERRPETRTDKRPETAAMVSPAGAATPQAAAERAAEPASELQERGADAAKRAAATQVEAMRDTAETSAATMRQTSGQGGRIMQEATDKSAETLSAAGESVGRGAEAFASMGRRNVESLQTSGSTVLDAARDLQQEWLGFWQAQIQESLRAGQALASCRTPQDLMEIQAQYARGSMERFIAGGSRLRDLTTRMMTLGFEPLQTAARRNLRDAAERTRG